MKLPTFEQFRKTFTNGVGRKERRFIEKFGDVSFEEAYPVYIEGIKALFGNDKKIEDFERYLISKGVQRIQSGKSESRYYYYNGVKYRFSSHIYPTGSMTELGGACKCIDFAANPELINTVKF